MGAWIETHVRVRMKSSSTVAPRVGAWIETAKCLRTFCIAESLPVWERGLKLLFVHRN